MRNQIIQGLERYGDHGWSWYELNWNGEGYTHYRTSIDGDGLWERRPTGAQYSDGRPERAWHQILGTCQFSLPTNRRAAYQKLYRQWIYTHKRPA